MIRQDAPYLPRQSAGYDPVTGHQAVRQCSFTFKDAAQARTSESYSYLHDTSGSEESKFPKQHFGLEQ